MALRRLSDPATAWKDSRMARPAAYPVELHTLNWGDRAAAGPRVLLLHGLPSSAGTWWRVADGLAAAGWSVTAADLRGHGTSPRTVSYALEAYAADVLRVDPGAAGPWDLVIGHSLGAAVSVVATDQQPGWAQSLLLLDPVLAVDPAEADALVADLLGDLVDPDPAALLAANPRWHVEDALQKAEAARLVSSHVVERTVRDNVGAERWQLHDTAARLAPPLHVLAADPARGASFSPADGERLTAAKADATVDTVRGAGHSVHRDDPEHVIRAALSRV
jgi:pimeloyl-ACP methyl ester carboxylesterase